MDSTYDYDDDANNSVFKGTQKLVDDSACLVLSERLFQTTGAE